MSLAWIGVDLDGTLAEYDHRRDIYALGPPIPAMVARVQDWLAKGHEVRVFTARVALSGAMNAAGVADDAPFVSAQRALIEAWCIEHLGRALLITATKDFQMIALYDDRAVAVETNTGRLLSGEAW